GSGREQSEVGLSGHQPGRRQSEMLVTAAAPRIGRELQRRLATPDTYLGLAELQLVSEANRQADRVAIKHPARRPHPQTPPLGGTANRIDGGMHGSDDRALHIVPARRGSHES